MAVTQGLQSLLAVFVVAALTPLPVAALPGPRIPHWNASWRTRFRSVRAGGPGVARQQRDG